jgi:hypothetical protein
MTTFSPQGLDQFGQGPPARVDFIRGHFQDFLAGVPEALISLPIELDGMAFQVMKDNGVHGIVEQSPEFFLALAQCMLRLLSRHDLSNDPRRRENAFPGQFCDKRGARVIGSSLLVKILHLDAIVACQFLEFCRITGRVAIADSDAADGFFAGTNRNGEYPDSPTALYIHRLLRFDRAESGFVPAGLMAVPFAGFHGLSVIGHVATSPRRLIHESTPVGRENTQGVIAIFLIHGAGGAEEVHKFPGNIREKRNTNGIKDEP